MCSLEIWRRCQAKFPCLTGRHGDRERDGEKERLRDGESKRWRKGEREDEEGCIKTSVKEAKTEKKKEKERERKSSKSKNSREQRTERERGRETRKETENKNQRERGTECADAAFLVWTPQINNQQRFSRAVPGTGAYCQAPDQALPAPTVTPTPYHRPLPLNPQLAALLWGRIGGAACLPACSGRAGPGTLPQGFCLFRIFD